MGNKNEYPVNLQNTVGNDVDKNATAWENMAGVKDMPDFRQAVEAAAAVDRAERMAKEVGDVQAEAQAAEGAGGVQVTETVAEESVEALTPEAGALAGVAKTFFAEKFPEMSDTARELRIEQAVQAGLSRMDGKKTGMMKYLASRGEELPEDYDENLLKDATQDMGRLLEMMYKEGSQVWRGGEELGDALKEDERIVWDLAMEPHKPGALDTVYLYTRNSRLEGEEPEAYKERLKNYTEQGRQRKEQLAKDAKFVQEHPELAGEFYELRDLKMDNDLRKEFPKALRIMQVSEARPENEIDENGEINLVWLYELRPRRDDETFGDYYFRVVREEPGLTKEEQRQLMADMAENARAAIAAEQAAKEQAGQTKNGEMTEEAAENKAAEAKTAQGESAEKMAPAEREGKVKQLFGKLRERVGWKKIAEKVMGAFAKNEAEELVEDEVEVATEAGPEEMVEEVPMMNEVEDRAAEAELEVAEEVKEEAEPEMVVEEKAEEETEESEAGEEQAEQGEKKEESVPPAPEQFAYSERELQVMAQRDMLVKRLAIIPAEDKAARMSMARAIDDADLKLLEVERASSVRRALAAEREGGTMYNTREDVKAEDFALSMLESKKIFEGAHDASGVEKMREMIAETRDVMLNALVNGDEVTANAAQDRLRNLRMASPALERAAANNANNDTARNEALAEVIPIEVAQESDDGFSPDAA